MQKLPHKGYGRIYCLLDEDVEAVKGIILEMDEFEHSYLPRDLIAPFSEYPRVVYTHKFDDLDMDALTATCWSRGIIIWVFNSGHQDFPPSQIKALTDGP